YIEKRTAQAVTGNQGPGNEYAVNIATLKTYFTVVDSPEEADFGVVFVRSPSGGSGYSVADANKGGNGYVPISLQYNDYKATNARAISLAGGDPFEDFTNRSYKNKTVTTSNKSDMDAVISMKKKMGDKPVIVMVSLSKQMVFAEIEGYADAILVGFGIQNQAFLDILSGKFEPSGLLPLQMPKNMKTVEEQYEDVPFDMDYYIDEEGNGYDFGFGMNWSGVINDERTAKYKK
ncbi:MAG: glycoside hydrolase family 3 protein, partial [Clostridia bacterium]|nr:glycoside hydrolase family 3 protein [Clostridia bacterium]